MEIKVSNISKSFVPSLSERLSNGSNGTVHAVSNVSFAIRSGEAYGLIGDNGAGKTTTLLMLAGLSEPDSGEILADGRTIREIGKEAYHSRVSFLTSEMRLDGFFTSDYLFMYFCRLHGLTKEKAEARKGTLFGEFGIDGFERKKISSLSTGMKQKVALAISAIPDPDLIIYDEPTNGLDIGSSKIVVDFLLSEKRKEKAVVISSHIFDVVSRVCDRVAILDGGKLIYESIPQPGDDLEKIYFTAIGKRSEK